MNLNTSQLCPVTFGETWVGPILDPYLTAIGKIKQCIIVRFAINENNSKNFILTSCTRSCSKNKEKRSGNVGRKFEHSSCSTNHVNGITDHAAIAEHFVSHFLRACTMNTAAGNTRLKGVYCDMRANYRGCVIDD